MTFDREGHQVVQPVTVHADGADAVRPKSTIQKDRESSLEKLKQFAATGKGDARQLPMLVHHTSSPSDVLPLMPDIAKHASGDVVLDCASVLEMRPVMALALAKSSTKKQPTTAHVRDWLRLQSAAGIASLDAAAVNTLRATQKGTFGEVFPQLSHLPTELHANRALIDWYITTTNSTIVAAKLTTYAVNSETLRATLDVVDEWGWLDHLDISASSMIGYGLTLLQSTKTTRPGVKAKLAALASKYNSDLTYDEKLKAKAKTDLDKHVADNASSDTDLLDAAARSDDAASDESQVKKRLTGESAEVVFQYLAATQASTKGHLRLGIELLAASKGPRQECLQAFLQSGSAAPMTQALADDRARRQVRATLGQNFNIRHLFSPLDWEQVHEHIVRDEALRQWAYQGADARDLLWVAVGSANGAKLGCRLVKAERGLAWLSQLPFDTDRKLLQRFILSSNDAKAVKLINDRYIRRDGKDSSYEKEDSEVKLIDSATYGTGTAVRLQMATAPKGGDAQQVLARLADMTEMERQGVLKQPGAVKDLLDDVSGGDLVRAIYLLAPTLPQLFAMPITQRATGLIGYVHTRATSEELAVVSDGRWLAQARVLFADDGPLTVFRSLNQPAQLAKALDDNDELLEWLLARTEPSRALSVLAREPVRKIAAQLMSERASVYAGLPAYELLTGDGQTAFDTVDKQIGDKDTKLETERYRDGDVATDRKTDDAARAFDAATEVPQLWTAIEQLEKAQAGKPAMLELVRRAPAAQKVALLDGTHADAVETLRIEANLGPQDVFPELPTPQLFSLKGAADWLLRREAPSTIFAMVSATPAALAPFGRMLDREERKAWIEKLPRGAELMPPERAVLDAICAYITNEKILKALFRTRFDVMIPEANTLDANETKKVWGIASRLPAAQINQQTLKSISEKDMGPAGQWASPHLELSSDPAKLKGTDHGYDHGQLLTLDEVKKLYGMTDQEVGVASQKNGWLEPDGARYRVKPQPLDQFTSTVLHEIGHSVDTMLGEHTDLVFGIGGWRKYGIEQFEQWANEMGGLDGISSSDRPKVIAAWKEALRSNTSVDKLVGADHPARDPKYATSPLVTAANNGASFKYQEKTKPVIRGRVFVQNDPSRVGH
jgi:hypothetical protein